MKTRRQLKKKLKESMECEERALDIWFEIHKENEKLIEWASYWKDMYGFACMERDTNIERVAELEKELEAAKEDIKFWHESYMRHLDEEAKQYYGDKEFLDKADKFFNKEDKDGSAD